MRDRAVDIAEDLDLDVTSVGDERLDVDVGHPKRRLRFGLAARVGGLDLGGIRDHAGATATAAGDCLDDHGPAIEGCHECARLVERHGAV